MVVVFVGGRGESPAEPNEQVPSSWEGGRERKKGVGGDDGSDGGDQDLSLAGVSGALRSGQQQQCGPADHLLPCLLRHVPTAAALSPPGAQCDCVRPLRLRRRQGRHQDAQQDTEPGQLLDLGWVQGAGYVGGWMGAALVGSGAGSGRVYRSVTDGMSGWKAWGRTRAQAVTCHRQDEPADNLRTAEGTIPGTTQRIMSR